jgi:hypothetical protein
MKLDNPNAVAYAVADALAEAGLRYALSGAVALAAHGVIRATRDVDVSLESTAEELDRVFDALERAGCLFERAQARREISSSRYFIVRCGTVKVDVFVSQHPHREAEIDRRVSVVAPDGKARWFSSAEDLAIHKLAMLRPKDHMDLELLFAAQAPKMDLAYVRHWVEAIASDPADRRRAALDYLIRRFANPA